MAPQSSVRHLCLLVAFACLPVGEGTVSELEQAISLGDVGVGATVPEPEDPVKEFQSEVRQLQDLAKEQHTSQEKRLARDKSSFEAKLLEDKYRTRVVEAANAQIESNLTAVQHANQRLSTDVSSLETSNRKMLEILHTLYREVGTSHKFINRALDETRDEHEIELEILKTHKAEPTLERLLDAARSKPSAPAPLSFLQLDSTDHEVPPVPEDVTKRAEEVATGLWQDDSELENLRSLQSGVVGNLSGLLKQMKQEGDASRLRLKASYMAAHEDEASKRSDFLEKQVALHEATKAEADRMRQFQESKAQLSQSHSQLRRWLAGVGDFARGADLLLEQASQQADDVVKGH